MLSRPDALFHSSHLGPEFWVLVLRLSVPNRVWDFMGSPFLTYLASNISRAGPSWFYHLKTVCVPGELPADFQTTRASGDRVPLLVQTWKLEGYPQCWFSYPDLVQTVEANLRARPAFELDVNSPGATRICALLVRGTCRSESLETKS